MPITEGSKSQLKQGEESIERESKQSSFGKKSHSSRSSSESSISQSSNSSTNERVIAEGIQIAELNAEASSVESKHATEYELEALRIQEQMVKAEARAKVFGTMDQQSTKSEADLMKRKNPTIQSRAIQRDICDCLLYQQHQQHLDNPRTQLLNKGQRRSVDNESSYMPRTGDRAFGSQRSSIEVSDVLCQLLKQQSSPDLDIDVFDCNPLNLRYYMTLVQGNG